MPYVQVAQGTASDVEQLGKFQGSFPEYSEGYVDIELRSQVAADIIGWLDEKLDVVGVPRNAVKVEGRFVRIYFRTEIAPLVLIASAIAACIFIVGLIVAWKLFKLSPEIAVAIGTGTMLLIAGAVLLVIFLIATRGRLSAGAFSLGGT